VLNNVKDFEAAGDGVTDDRGHIQDAIDDAAANDKAGIFFPSGTYRVSYPDTQGVRWSLDLNGVRDFMVLGEGALNRIDPNVPSPLVGITNLPANAVVIAGATSTGGTAATTGAGRTLTGLGDPTNTVTGNVGDIFQRLDGTPGATPVRQGVWQQHHHRLGAEIRTRQATAMSADGKARSPDLSRKRAL
jgi:hypothetical protein